MTTINTLDDFLQALDANPSWREAVRARILGEELLQLPVRFEAFAQEQKTWNTNVEARLNRIEGDMAASRETTPGPAPSGTPGALLRTGAWNTSAP